MLRIAVWFENRLGRNDGNPLYVFAALKRLEEKGLLEVDHLIPNGDVKPFGKYDLNIWVDWGEDGLTGLLPYHPDWPVNGAPILYWASDTHLGYSYRMETACESDLVFVAQKDAIDRFKNDGVDAPVYWMPHAVEPSAYCDPSQAIVKQGSFTPHGDLSPYCFAFKKYDVCFVGHINSGNRVKALDKLFREFPNFFYGQRLFNQAAEIYAQSKIAFNIAMQNDVNMRCFEVMGSGSLLLTDRIPTIEELMTDRIHCVMYNDPDDMIQKARYYIEHDEEREAIAKAGYEHTMKHHTIDSRVEFMLEKALEHGLIKETIWHKV